MAHGGDDDWNTLVTGAVAALPSSIPTSIALGMADRASLGAALAEMSARGVRRIVVVRLFVSPQSFLSQTEWLLGLTRDRPAFVIDRSDTEGVARSPLRYDVEVAISRRALADAEVVGEILLDRATQLSASPEKETVLFLAHGMASDADNDWLLGAMRSQAEAIRATCPFRRVVVDTVREDWPEARVAAVARIRGLVTLAAAHGDVLVVPFRLAGFGPYAEILSGLEYRAQPLGFLPHPAITEWILETAAAEAARNGWQ